MIQREAYINKLFEYKDKQLIKIITGVRRSGKSTLFELYQEKLTVPKKQIQNINLEDPAFSELSDWKKLYNYINEKIVPNKQNYIFIDEVQNIKDFQKAVDGLFIKKNVDLYLTGSNSKMQSGEWATLLSGRYIEIHIFPLSFKEYYSFFNTLNKEDAFVKYLENSSFPYTIQLNNKKQIEEYLSGIYNTIVLKDIVENKKIRDVSNLDRIIKFMADNIGNITSVKKISDTISSDGFKILPMTVQSYLQALSDSYILYKTQRYDIKGKKLLQTLDKYYLVDIGLRYNLLGNKKTDLGRMLENIVYLELLRRGYKVYVGKINDKEIDFIAENYDGIKYYQVAQTVRDEKTLERELYPLNSIKDHYPKFLLTRDIDPKISHNGITQLNVIDWLLEE